MKKEVQLYPSSISFNVCVFAYLRIFRFTDLLLVLAIALHYYIVIHIGFNI